MTALEQPAEKRRRIEAPPAAIVPDDLLFSEVLPRLPVSSLMRFKSVCRTWRDAIEGPAVARPHLALSRARPPAMLVVPREDYHLDATAKSQVVSFHRLLLGDEARAPDAAGVELVFEKEACVTHTVVPTHCDGLVALATTTGEVFVCNPATREFAALPPGTRSHRAGGVIGAPAAALGYDPSRNRYIVARYFYREYSETTDMGAGTLCVEYDIGHEVFTLGDGGGGAWEATDDPPHAIAAARPICTREAIYWCAEHSPENALLRFDLRDRAFDVAPCPPGTDFDYAIDHVTELEGKLCYVHAVRDSNTAFDVWVAGDGRRPEWSLRCRVDLADPALGGEAFLPVAAAGGEMLIAVDYRKVYGYDERVKSLRLVVDMEEELLYKRQDGSNAYDDDDPLQHHVVRYVESLVSIRGERAADRRRL